MRFLHEIRVLGHLRFLPKRLKTIAIIGAGRIGGWTAFFLAKKGVKSFVLIDDDKVSEDNIKREGEVPYNFFDLDDYKVDALKRRMLVMHPDLKIRKYRMHILPETRQRKLNEMFEDVALIIFAVDTREGLMLAENIDLMSSHLAVIPAMHAQRGGGHVIVWVPSETACPKHSLGLESFDDIIESRALDSNISLRDIRMISKHTADIVEYLLFFRINNLWKRIDLEKSNYLHVDKLIFGIYRKQWLPKLNNQDCFLCNYNLF